MYFKDTDIHISSLTAQILVWGVPAATYKAAVRLSALHGSLLQSFTQHPFQFFRCSESSIFSTDSF
jgi:hypothetical protein